MCALGCWWGGKITVLQFFFRSWYKKKYKKQQIYIRDVQAPTDIFILLWYCSATNNIVSFFFFWVCCENLRNWPTHTAASVIVVLASSNLFHCTEFGSKSNVSLCEAQQIVKGTFLLTAPEPRGCHWFSKPIFFRLWCIAFLKLLRCTELRSAKLAERGTRGRHGTTLWFWGENKRSRD